MEKNDISLEIRQFALTQLSSLTQKKLIPDETKAFLYEKISLFLEWAYKTPKIQGLLEKILKELLNNEKKGILVSLFSQIEINAAFEANVLFSRLTFLRILAKCLEDKNISVDSNVFQNLMSLLSLVKLENLKDETSHNLIIILKILHSLLEVPHINFSSVLSFLFS